MLVTLNVHGGFLDTYLELKQIFSLPAHYNYVVRKDEVQETGLYSKPFQIARKKNTEMVQGYKKPTLGSKMKID